MHQLGNRPLIIGRNAVEHGLSAGIECLGHQRRRVGVANLSARRHVTRRDQLRAQRDDANTWGSVLPYLGRRREPRTRALVAIAVEHIDDLVFHHGIGTFGHRRARHDADRLARANCALKHMARGLVSDNVERHRRLTRCLRQIRRAHGISVHSAVGKRRDVDIAFQVDGGDAAGRIQHGDRFRRQLGNVR